MKSHTALFALVLLPLAGCAHVPGGTGLRYAGSPGSTYDAAGNPPQTNGAVTYDPASPLTPHDYGNSGKPAPALTR